MARLFLVIIIVFIFSCSPRHYTDGCLYLIRNEALDKNISSPHRYISYKNFLFEFVTKISKESEQYNNQVKNGQAIVSHHFINVLPKNAGIIFKIDSFKIGSKVEAKIKLADKKGGITLTKPDEMAKQLYKKFNAFTSKDTTINNLLYKMLDTTFKFNDTIVITDYAFFYKQKNLNTVFNISASEHEKSIFPYTLAGLVAKMGNNVVAKYLITDFSELTENEILICEDIIKKINSYKDQ